VKERISQLIDFSETIIRTDIRYVARGYFWYFIEYGIAAITGLATSVAFANFMAPESYGVFKYVLTFLPFLGLASLKRLNDSLTISVARGFENDTIQVLKTKIKWGLLGSSAGLALSLYYFFRGDQTLALLIMIVALFIPIFDPPFIFSSFLVGKKNFKLLTILTSTCNAFYGIAIIAAVYFSRNVFLIIFIYFAANIFIRSLALWLTLRLYPPNDKKEARTISYGKKFSLLEIINVAASYLDNIMVFHYLGAVELAAYAFIKKVPEQLKDLPSFLAVLSSPKFATKNIADPFIKKESLRKSLLLSLFMLAIALVYILLAPLFFKIFFKSYVDFVWLSQLYAISLPLGVFGLLFQNFIESTRQERSLVKLNTVLPIIKIAVMFTAIKFWGLTGLVSSFLVIRLLTPLVITYVFYSPPEPET